MASFLHLSSLQLLFIIQSALVFYLLDLSTAKSCPRTQSCSQIGSSAVRFPFRISNPDDDHGDQSRCVYPGFDLSCRNNSNSSTESYQTAVSLPSGDFTVLNIFYASQTMIVADPLNCLPRRFLERNFTVVGTPFRVENLGSFTFLNCSSASDFGQEFEAVPCLSGEGYTVVALPSVLFESLPSFCGVLASVSIPVVSSNTWWVNRSWEFYLTSSIRLAWEEPRCGACERRGGDCRLIGGDGLEIGCFDLGNNGHSKEIKYALFAITGLAAVGFICFKYQLKCHPIRGLSNLARVCTRPNPNGPLESNDMSEPNQPSQTSNNTNVGSSRAGIDKLVFKTYPKRLVGESRRLLRANYNACPICLSEYRSNDTLKTLPDCSHHFHSGCIEEWLRLNASCPLCRRSPPLSHYIVRSPSMSRYIVR